MLLVRGVLFSNLVFSAKDILLSYLQLNMCELFKITQGYYHNPCKVSSVGESAVMYFVPQQHCILILVTCIDTCNLSE